MGIALSAVLLALLKGRYCGLGTNLINASLAGGTVYAWDWALKLVLTALTLSAGYQGGEVTPLFSIGASLGAAVSGLLGLPAALCAGLGYAAVFGSATNTLIAPHPHRRRGLRLALRALCAHNMCACIRGQTAAALSTPAREDSFFAALHRKLRRNGREFVLQRALGA